MSYEDDYLEQLMAEAGILKPPPVDPPMPPLQPGDRPSHKGSHEWVRTEDSDTQPFTHMWRCTRIEKRPCEDFMTRPCTQYLDRFGGCKCFEGGE